MTLEFQEKVLQYLLQEKTAKKFVSLVDDSCFEQPYDKLIYKMLAEYTKEFGNTPSKISMLEYFSIQSKKAGLKEEITAQMVRRVKLLYEPIDSDTGLIRKSIRAFAQRLQTKHLFINNTEKVADGDDKFFEKLYSSMSKISKLSDEQTDEDRKGGFMLKDFDKFSSSLPEGKPTDFSKWNGMTAAKGFHTPQLIVLMGAPKAFKTGTMLLTAMGYVRDGMRVYYADCENGIEDLIPRTHQAILECERWELKLPENRKLLPAMVEQWKKLGGDMHIEIYPSNSKTLEDVDEDLQRLKDEHGWVPELIVYDYLDLFEPADKSVKETRFKIQHVYKHAIRLNMKYGCFAITVSPVGRNAVSKEVINMKDFSEDFAKAYNCHGSFALCRTETEVKAGVMRLIPVAQRSGEQYDGTEKTTCYFKIEEKKMFLAEITKEEHSTLVEAFLIDRPQEGRNKRASRSLKDE